MPRALIIISQKNFSDEEFSAVKSALVNGKVQVTIASITNEEARGTRGMKVTPNKTVAQALKDDFDAVILIGGSGSPTLADYPEVIETLKRQNQKKRIVAGICLAPIVLARAGILVDVMSTVYPEDWAISSITRDGAHYFDKSVIEDGNIVTANGPKSAVEFAETILKKLKS